MVTFTKDEASCFEQGSLDWYRARLGYITSSMVYNVMLEPTKKDLQAGELFSGTAKNYLYKVAAERNMKDRFIKDDDNFTEYLDRTNVSTRAMRYGSETEAVARKVYSGLKGVEVVECGFIYHETIPLYGDSPDGIILDNDGRPAGCLEIKCPSPETWMRYKDRFSKGESLIDVEDKYYWQAQSHCFCNGLEWCDFVYFDKMQQNGIGIVTVPANDADIKRMEERIILANQFINNLIAK